MPQNYHRTEVKSQFNLNHNWTNDTANDEKSANNGDGKDINANKRLFNEGGLISQ